MSTHELVIAALGDEGDQLTWTHVMIGLAIGAALGIIVRLFSRKK